MKIGLFAIALTCFAAAGFAPLNEDAVGLQGSYLVAPSADLRACAAACESDGLCMSWAFSTEGPVSGQCALSAVTPTNGVTPGLAWGLSSRASRFEWQAAAPKIDAETAMAAAAEPAFRNPFEAMKESEADSGALLGGPEGADGLRLRFAEERATTP